MKIRFLMDPEFWRFKLEEELGYDKERMAEYRAFSGGDDLDLLFRIQDLAALDGYKLRMVLDQKALVSGFPDSAYKECWKAGVAPDEEYHEFQSDLRFDFERYVRQFAEEQGLIPQKDEVET